MDVKDRIIVITGAASGIGRALAQEAAARGARHVVCVDLNEQGAVEVAEKLGGTGIGANCGREADISSLIQKVEKNIGPIDIFVGNAGVIARGGCDVPDVDWQRSWDVNVMQHVFVARHLVPKMVERGRGYIVITASAAGLLNQATSASYATTKHAAVGLAEWLAITYGPAGIGVSVLCPQAVRTAMFQGSKNTGTTAAVDGVVEAEDAAKITLDAMRAGSFIILTHPTVLEYMRRKTGDYDRWIRGMQRLAEKMKST
jgi:NAD(P)-dependent dehydrogenase (short-subunit alcohol dehydrogenase family)